MYLRIEKKVKGYKNLWRTIGYYLADGRKMKNAAARLAHPFSDYQPGQQWDHNNETYRIS